MNTYKYLQLLILTLFMLFFSGCNSANVKANQYSLKECKKEMLNADDYVASDSVDKIVVIKKKRRMYLYKGGKVVASYPVSLGKNPVGQKVQKGDNRTPEGQFWIHRKLCSPKYYRSLCISYPRPQDVARAEAKGLNPGGDITIHAQPKWNANGNGDKYTLGKNWTQGCVAITNSDMNKLWYAVREGVPVTIK